MSVGRAALGLSDAMEMAMSVQSCICHDLSFEHLLLVARERELGLEALKRETGCCTSCALCEPYVAEMLRTGQTEFEVMSVPSTRADDRAGRCGVTTSVTLGGAECTVRLRPPSPGTAS